MSADYLHQLLEDYMGYSFNDNDLSPDTRRKISGFLTDAQKLQHLKEEEPGLRRRRTAFIVIFFLLGWLPIVSFFFLLNLYVLLIGGLFLFISLPFVLQKPPKPSFDEKYDLFRKRIQPLVNEIHKELSEAHKLKLRPEVVEYKIITDFSLRDGGFVVKCPSCSGRIDVIKDKIEGNRYKCPYCENAIVFPDKILRLL